VSYLDPDSGRTFTAWSFPDPQGNELSASARMVRRALALDARCRDEQLDPADSAAACAERQRFTADLDLHLSMYEAFSAAVE
jgi:hypothetical protein